MKGQPTIEFSRKYENTIRRIASLQQELRELHALSDRKEKMCIRDRDARVRCDCVNRIMVRCWKYIKPFLDYCEEHGDPQSGGTGTVTTVIRGAGGGSAIGSGVTSPVTGGPEPSEESMLAPNRAATQADADGEAASAPIEFEEEDADNAATALAQGLSLIHI